MSSKWQHLRFSVSFLYRDGNVVTLMKIFVTDCPGTCYAASYENFIKITFPLSSVLTSYLMSRFLCPFRWVGLTDTLYSVSWSYATWLYLHVIILTECSSLNSPEVVVLTTFDADDDIVIYQHDQCVDYNILSLRLFGLYGSMPVCTGYVVTPLNTWWLHQMETDFPRYWPFVRGIHRSPVNSPHKGQWRGALMFFFDLRLNKRFSKHWWGWWFETPSRPLWRHCNDI